MNENIKKYFSFLDKQRRLEMGNGFEPIYIPDYAFPYQKFALERALLAGRYAYFIDTGMGKTLLELLFADNVVKKTNKNVIIFCPLAVAYQFEKEAEKFGIEVSRSNDGKPSGKITITNYQKIHMYNPDDYICSILDESSILKNESGATKQKIVEFMRKHKYKLLATATAAPNDFIELGTSSESLGYLKYMEMIENYFRNTSNDKNPQWNEPKYVLKDHAVQEFFRWVCSWSIALRKPSDAGFSDENYNLPELVINEIEVQNNKTFDGWLFAKPAETLSERREESKLTLKERCKVAAELSSKHDISVSWVHLDDESKMLKEMIPDSYEVTGKMSDEQKEENLIAFQRGEIKKLIIKPKIGGFGLNWQHCNHSVYFPTDSYEQYYQSIRRIYRFGNKSKKVTIDIPYSQGQIKVIKNLKRKSKQADEMFTNLVKNMNNALKVDSKKYKVNKINLPYFLEVEK